MKFVCDKCGFCCESDVDHPDIWIGTKYKNSDGFEWEHCCYNCGKQMIESIRQNDESEGEKNE